MPVVSQSEAHSPAAPENSAKTMLSGLRIVSLCTMLSRVLGLIRDMGMAALFGNGYVMDAFSVAFRIPNLARRLFGEGALSTAFLPVFVRERENNGSEAAWRLVSAALFYFCIALAGLVLLGELGLWLLRDYVATTEATRFLLLLTQTMLPYLALICLAAQIGAVLHGLGHFTWPALLPVVLNIIWIAAIWLGTPYYDTPEQQAIFLSLAIVFAGLLQLAAPFVVLRWLGFRFDFAWQSAGDRIRETVRNTLPILVGLSVTQLNSLVDSLFAWGLATHQTDFVGHQTGSWTLESGTAAALYFGQRLYQFPLGVFGVALGTVLFPLLSKHAEQGRFDRMQSDLLLGIRLIIVIGLPASAGLVLMAEPLTILLFQHGAFNAADVAQTSRMIQAYGVGVWAACALLILQRAFYALGDRLTPLRIGLIAMGVNLALNVVLLYFVGGVGLAMSTTLATIAQTLLTLALVNQRFDGLNIASVWPTAVKAVLATIVMALACVGTQYVMPNSDSLVSRAATVAVPLLSAVAIYFGASTLLRLDDVWMVFRHRDEEKQ